MRPLSSHALIHVHRDTLLSSHEEVTGRNGKVAIMLGTFPQLRVFGKRIQKEENWMEVVLGNHEHRGCDLLGQPFLSAPPTVTSDSVASSTQLRPAFFAR